MSPIPKKRGKYGRPCDHCAARRIRCVFSPQSSRCDGCINFGHECTQNRVRKKSGPKTSKTKGFDVGTASKEEAPFAMNTFSEQPGSAGSSLPNSAFDTQIPPEIAHSASHFPLHFLGVPLPLSQDIPPVDGSSTSRGGFPSIAPDYPVSPQDPTEDLSPFKLNYTGKYSLENLLSRLQIYQTWFYGYWPVLSVADMISTISEGSQVGYGGNNLVLTDKNAMTYSLCCAVCAAITTQISFVSSKSDIMDDCTISAEDYAYEAKRIRSLFDYMETPNVESLLTSFFLYAHYTNQKGQLRQAIMFLREAVTIAQLLGLHEPETYNKRSRAEVHRWRKIYYTLLVTERYVCFEDGMPVILDADINFPQLEDEEYPNLLYGFTELIKVFSVPSKEFFLEMNMKKRDTVNKESKLSDKKQWIMAVQDKLSSSSQGSPKITSSQKLNLLLSKSWIRAIACHITWKNGMLRESDNSNDCFSFNFPLTNAREFLSEALYLPNTAFETNGPGICVKLLEITSSLASTVHRSSDQLSGFSVLETLFGLINKFKNDVTMPMDIYQNIANLLAKRKLANVPRLIRNEHSPEDQQIHRSPIIEELIEDTEENEVSETQPPLRNIPSEQPEHEQYINMSASLVSMLSMKFPSMDETTNRLSPYFTNLKSPDFSPNASERHSFSS